MNKRKGSIASVLITVIAAIIILSVIALICYYVHEHLSYGAKEGIIIDKQYSPAHTYTTYNNTYVNRNSISMPIQHYSAERYCFIIQKEVKRKLKSVDVNVTQEEFNNYNIGDYFKR